MRLGQTTVVHFGSHLLTTAVGFLATWFIASTLGATVYGTYVLVIAILVWLLLVTNLGIRDALVKRLSEVDTGGEYLGAAFVLQSGLFVLLSIGIYLARGFINEFVGAPVSEALIALLASRIFFELALSALEGSHQVHIAGIIQPIERGFRSLFHVAIVLAGLGLFGLVGGYVASSVLGAIIGFAWLSIRPNFPTKEAISRVIEFAKFSWLSVMESKTFNTLDTLVLGVFVAPAFVGIYQIGWNVASFMAVFGSSVARSSFPELSRHYSDGELGNVVGILEDSLAFTGIFVIPGLVGATFLGGDILAIYGPEFEQGHLVLVLLIGARMLYAYHLQFITVLNGIDRPDLAFRINGVFIGTNLVLNIVLVATIGWVGAAIATMTAAGIGLVIGGGITLSTLKVSLPLKPIGSQFVAAGLMGVALIVVPAGFSESIVGLVGVVGGGAFLYFGSLWVLSESFRVTLRRNLPEML